MLFLDIQTNQDSILEIAWMNFAGDLCQTYLVNQDGPLHSVTKSLTGLSDHDLTQAKPIQEVLDVLQHTLADQPKIVVHYLVFEQRILAQYGINLDQAICLHKLAKEKIPSIRSHSLRALCGFLGLDLPQHKRAYHHAALSRQIWLKIHSPTFGEEYSKPHLEMSYKSLPDSPGIYFFKDHNDTVLYVGKAKSLKKRVKSYFRPTKGKHSEMLACSHKIEYLSCSNELEAFLKEYSYIRKLRPYYNDIYNGESSKAFYLDATLQKKILARRSEYAHYGPYYNTQFYENFCILQHNLKHNRSSLGDYQIPFHGLDDLELFQKAWTDFTSQYNFHSMRQAIVIGYHLRHFAKQEHESTWTYERVWYSIHRWIRQIALDFFIPRSLLAFRRSLIHVPTPNGYNVLVIQDGCFKQSFESSEILVLPQTQPTENYRTRRWSHDQFHFLNLLRNKIRSTQCYIVTPSHSYWSVHKKSLDDSLSA